MRSNLSRIHVQSQNSSPSPSPTSYPSSSSSSSSMNLGMSSKSKGSDRAWSFESHDMMLVLAHCLGLACSVFVLAWIFRFRGGLPFMASTPALALTQADDLVFNVHPVLMLIGYIVLTSEAILVFKGVHGTKSYKKGIHLTIQALAFVMAILGIWAAFKFHNAKGIDNLYSLHSWLGIMTVVLFSLQWISAYFVYWYPGAIGKVRAAMLPWHVFMGLSTYSMALITAQTGFLEKMTFLIVNKVIERYSLEAMFVNSTALLLVVYGLVVILVSVVPKATEGEALRNLD